jgi:hypothetical protein
MYFIERGPHPGIFLVYGSKTERVTFFQKLLHVWYKKFKQAYCQVDKANSLHFTECCPDTTGSWKCTYSKSFHDLKGESPNKVSIAIVDGEPHPELLSALTNVYEQHLMIFFGGDWPSYSRVTMIYLNPLLLSNCYRGAQKGSFVISTVESREISNILEAPIRIVYDYHYKQKNLWIESIRSTTALTRCLIPLILVYLKSLYCCAECETRLRSPEETEYGLTKWSPFDQQITSKTKENRSSQFLTSL